MNILHRRNTSPRKRTAGFSLVEAVIGMGVAAVTMFAVYAAINFGFTSIGIARENLRATQIVTEKMEVIRLCNWDQITTPGYLPATFTANYYGTGTNGLIYNGTLVVGNTGMPVNYSNDVKRVTVAVTWTSKGMPHSRTLTTQVSKYGEQRYVYN